MVTANFELGGQQRTVKWKERAEGENKTYVSMGGLGTTIARALWSAERQLYAVTITGPVGAEERNVPLTATREELDEVVGEYMLHWEMQRCILRRAA